MAFPFTQAHGNEIEAYSLFVEPDVVREDDGSSSAPTTAGTNLGQAITAGLKSGLAGLSGRSRCSVQDSLVPTSVWPQSEDIFSLGDETCYSSISGQSHVSVLLSNLFTMLIEVWRL